MGQTGWLAGQRQVDGAPFGLMFTREYNDLIRQPGQSQPGTIKIMGYWAPEVKSSRGAASRFIHEIAIPVNLFDNC